MFVLGGAARSMQPPMAPANRSKSNSSPSSSKSSSSSTKSKAHKAPIGIASVHVQPTLSKSANKVQTGSNTSSGSQSYPQTIGSVRQNWVAPPPTYQKHAPSDLSCVCHGGQRFGCEDCVAQRNYLAGYEQALQDSLRTEERRRRQAHARLPRLSRASTLESLREEDETE